MRSRKILIVGHVDIAFSIAIEARKHVDNSVIVIAQGEERKLDNIDPRTAKSMTLTADYLPPTLYYSDYYERALQPLPVYSRPVNSTKPNNQNFQLIRARANNLRSHKRS